MSLFIIYLSYKYGICLCTDVKIYEYISLILQLIPFNFSG